MWTRRAGTQTLRRTARASLCASLCASAALCAAANDDRALQQALTIVQLLRAEYGRSFLRMTEPPAPTCAPTTALRPTPAGPSRRHWTTWYKESNPQRRFDYDEFIGEHPSPVTASKPSLPTSTITSSPHNIVNHDPTSPTTNIQSSLTPVHSTSDSVSISTLLKQQSLYSRPSSTPTVLTKTTPPAAVSHVTKLSHIISISSQSVINLSTKSAALDSERQTPQRFKNFPKNEQGSSAPELHQMAMELAVELKASGEVRPALVERPATKRPRQRATWREYLARSTRYAVPLPENHAFCYTDPHNALCRTFI